MAESAAPPPPPPTLPNPNYPADSPPPPPPPAPSPSPSPNPILSCFSSKIKRPSVRVTSEFDSDSSVFFHKVSCKLFDSLAKLKVSFNNDHKGEVSPPHVSFISQYLSIHYSFEDQSTLLNSSVDVGPRLQFRASHDLKAQQGEATMVAKLADPGYAFQLSSPFPSAGLPKATLKFPLGEVTLEEKEEEETNKMLSINGIVKGQLLNGLCTAHYMDEELKLRYSFKDEELSFIPSISLPSNALSFAFKRRFGPSDKLSYWYNFDSNYWSTVYKHTYGKDLKLKAGYDSEVRLGWASLWVGDEGGKAKTAPLKMKVQFMLQVPQDDIRSSALMFRVKKRWDI
ncbi:outer envelope pore protein 37, chloroplastic [Rosa sericea]